ncbi:MAG TPA: PA14 domain-containing protein [Methanocella sp.]|nr:PA14 domain-containing protein [Methanocella sp.]
MDDSGVADAFYTVLSIGIVLVAALAVSGVVLSSVEQGRDPGLADLGGMEKGLYSFYYAVDGPRSDYLSGDPDDIVPERLSREGADEAVAFNASVAPSAPGAMAAVLWSGFLYVPSDGAYELQLSSAGQAWVWVDGVIVAANRDPAVVQVSPFTLQLSRGYHPFKAKYFYPELRLASCSLSWKQGGRMVTVGSFYR